MRKAKSAEIRLIIEQMLETDEKRIFALDAEIQELALARAFHQELDRMKGKL